MARPQRGILVPALLAALAGAGVGVGGWLLWPSAPLAPVPAIVVAPIPAPAAVPVPAPVVAPAIPEIVADEATIRAHDPVATTLFQFAPNPRILVLDFASLATQARMLNRAAALIEKVGLPRDRVLSDAELAQAIRASGVPADEYYYGHDYRISDLDRFFRLADRDHIALTPQEKWLRALLAEQATRPDPPLALITIPKIGGPIDAKSRAVILHHELSHGEYFSNPVYADFVHRFWSQIMSSPERAKFRHWLTTEGYDPGINDLIINETQAYLMHTDDPRFFSAAAVGLSPATLTQLRIAFLIGMPPGWLRDCTSLH